VNQQEQQFHEGTILPVMEHFYTIQGEGFNTGKAAYFVRLGGCDVGCPWCDVKESWNAEKHPLMAIEEIYRLIAVSKAEFCVITGGEPSMYNLKPLTDLLVKNGIKTAIETSGTNEITGNWHWVCLSPKKFKPTVEASYLKANELKIIVFNKHDFIYAEEQAAKVKPACLLFLQPEWEKREEMMPMIVEYVKQNPKWKISLQTHKYLNIP
jgi:organic radical activating enzyme